MKYKKGDKVRVRNKLKIEACYGKLKDGCGVVFCFEQSQYKGHTVTIDRVNDYGGYKILEDACNFTWTDEMFENICYKNFGIRGSFIQLTAFKEVTEEMGYKYRKSFIDFSAENFKIDDGNLSRGLFFSILGVDSVIKKGEMSLSRLHGEYEENIIFTIPSQISEAYLYAKEALEWLRLVKYPEYVIVEKAEIGSGQASNGMYGKKSDKPHANGCVGTPDVVYELANGKVWGFLDGSQFKAITKDEYEEEIKKTNNKFEFGGRKWIIKNGLAKDEDGMCVTLSEAEQVIFWINSTPSVCGYTMTVDNSVFHGELTTLLFSGSIGFGCCKDSYSKIFEFHKLLKESNEIFL